MDEHTRALAYSALAAAAGTAVLYLCSLLPTLRAALLCVAGLGTAFIRMRCSWKWGLGCYAVTAAAALLLLPEKMPAVLYAAFFGYYPIILLLTERLKNPVLRWGARLLVFNTVLVILLFTARTMFASLLSAGAEKLWILIPVCNAAFLAYDWALRQLILYYIRNLSRRIK